MGDGDFMMVMQELSALAQYQIPVVIIIANNCGWMAIKDLQSDVLGEERTFRNRLGKKRRNIYPDFHAIAQAFGIHSRKISQSDQVAEAVKNRLPATGRRSLRWTFTGIILIPAEKHSVGGMCLSPPTWRSVGQNTKKKSKRNWFEKQNSNKLGE